MALKGIKVLEIAGLAPAPFAGMILADFGADVVRVDQLGKFKLPDGMSRGKRSVAINLKKPKGTDTFKRLCKQSDVLIEPFRPGVMEKLGLGPDVLMKQNPRLVYARLSGFGQSGPYRHMAGHDINYIATSGILSRLSASGKKPQAPLNLIADFAGGGLLCAFGVLTALFERERSGLGQVIDVNMTAGASYLGTFVYSLRDQLFSNPSGYNLLDTGCPFYDTYKTKDNRYVAVGALEPQFYKKLIGGLGLNQESLPPQMDIEKWPILKKVLKEEFAKYTLNDLKTIFDGSDACVTAVLSLDEAPQHPHNRANESFYSSNDGLMVPTPAPKLSRTPGIAGKDMNIETGNNSREILREMGFSDREIANLEIEAVINRPCESSKL